jgi:hypothetical protein
MWWPHRSETQSSQRTPGVIPCALIAILCVVTFNAALTISRLELLHTLPQYLGLRLHSWIFMWLRGEASIRESFRWGEQVVRIYEVPDACTRHFIPVSSLLHAGVILGHIPHAIVWGLVHILAHASVWVLLAFYAVPRASYQWWSVHNRGRFLVMVLMSLPTTFICVLLNDAIRRTWRVPVEIAIEAGIWLPRRSGIAMEWGLTLASILIYIGCTFLVAGWHWKHIPRRTGVISNHWRCDLCGYTLGVGVSLCPECGPERTLASISGSTRVRIPGFSQPIRIRIVTAWLFAIALVLILLSFMWMILVLRSGWMTWK